MKDLQDYTRSFYEMDIVVDPPAPHKDDHENTPAIAGGLGGGPYNRVTESAVNIAKNLGGTGESTSGNRLADALEEIAYLLGAKPGTPSGNRIADAIGEIEDGAKNIVVPTGVIQITENGNVDVTEFAFASVNVEATPNEMIPITLNTIGSFAGNIYFYNQDGEYTQGVISASGGSKTVYVPQKDEYVKFRGVVAYIRTSNAATGNATGLNAKILSSTDAKTHAICAEITSDSATHEITITT